MACACRHEDRLRVGDFTRSTEEIHGLQCMLASEIGLRSSTATEESRYAAERRSLDPAHHAQYTRERVALQDALVDHALGCEAFGNALPQRPSQPWLFFTAGPIAAGKTHVARWLGENGLDQLRHSVRADPDQFREHLPEWPVYKAVRPETAGALTKKEVGLLTEVTTEAAMANGFHVWQDGSLQDTEFFKARFDLIRQRFPQYRIAVVYVSADELTICRRARERADSSGRVVPEEEIQKTLRRAPVSYEKLAPLADLSFIVDNPDAGPVLRQVHLGPSSLPGNIVGGVAGLRGLFAEVEKCGSHRGCGANYTDWAAVYTWSRVRQTYRLTECSFRSRL